MERLNRLPWDEQERIREKLRTERYEQRKSLGLSLWKSDEQIQEEQEQLLKEKHLKESLEPRKSKRPRSKSPEKKKSKKSKRKKEEKKKKKTEKKKKKRHSSSSSSPPSSPSISPESALPPSLIMQKRLPPPSPPSSPSSSESLSNFGPNPLPSLSSPSLSPLPKTNYGGALLPGEGDAIAQYVQTNQRIPRRGEIGMSSTDIEAMEKIGYVMSGSSHKRMNIIRLRKEQQVIEAEQARLDELRRKEDKVKREAGLINELSDLLKKQQEIFFEQDQLEKEKQARAEKQLH